MNNLVFHIGHHKTATTYLQSIYFSNHPEINLVCNYRQPWDDEFLSYLIGSTERSFSICRCRELLENSIEKQHIGNRDNKSIKVQVISSERLSGHPYSGGYDSYILAERIHDLCPEAKIIICIRNQPDILKSLYKQLVQEGYLGTFSDLINSKHWKSTSFCMDMLEYDLLIAKYFDLFSQENILTLVYDDLVNNPKSFVNQISSFLNIGNFEHPDIKTRVRKGKKDSEIKIQRYLNKFRKTELNPFPIIEINPKFMKILAKLLQVILVKNKFTLIEDNELKFIKDYYYESNMRLKNILQTNLIWMK